MRQPLSVIVVSLFLAAAAYADPNPLAARVLVLVNDAMPAEAGTGGTGASVFIGEYYAAQRGIPKTNIVHLKTDTGEYVSYTDYLSQVEKPVKAALEANGGDLKQKILYIVPTYGVPLKAAVTSDQLYAVDSL